MTRRHFRPSILVLTLLLLAAARAQTEPANPAPSPDPDAPRPILSRINSLLDGDLPQLDIPGTIKVIFRPHFGDLINRDYMRVNTGLRWALDDHFEIFSEAAVYFTHGLGEGESVGSGLGQLRLGSRYVREQWPSPLSDTSFSLGLQAPVNHPPVDMTDGQYHIVPGFVLQTKSASNPKLTTFGGLGLDLIDSSSIPGEFYQNQPHDHSINGTLGAIYDLGQLKYTLSFTYATTAVLGSETEHFFYLQPGVLWYLPSKLTFNSKTQWIVSFGLRSSWGPDGTDFSVRTRVRAEITFRQVMENIRHTWTRGEVSP